MLPAINKTITGKINFEIEAEFLRQKSFKIDELFIFAPGILFLLA